MANAEQFYDVIRRPIMTEKSSGAQETGNKFTFEVSNESNKVEVRKAIETLFSAVSERQNGKAVETQALLKLRATMMGQWVQNHLERDL